MLNGLAKFSTIWITLLTQLNGNQTIEKFNVYNLMDLYIYIFTHKKDIFINITVLKCNIIKS